MIDITVRFNVVLSASLMVFAGVPLRAEPFLAARSAIGTLPSPGVALAWDPSPDGNAAGYLLCWGLSSGSCTNLLDVGTATGITVGGLSADAAYYFTVVAYDDAGDQSAPSSEIAYAIAPRLSIQSPAGGGSRGVLLNFQGMAGFAYSLQATPDFTNWTTLSTTNCSATGPLVFQVSEPGSYPARFYRLIQH
ncbi:MAG: fibronectin type III domain-containing protein [Verrucomicrobiota bacterium]